MSDSFSTIISRAGSVANYRNHSIINIEHIFGACLIDDEVFEIIHAVGSDELDDFSIMGNELAQHLDSIRGYQTYALYYSGATPVLTEDAARLLRDEALADNILGSLDQAGTAVTPETKILLAILRRDPNRCFSTSLLHKYGITYDRVVEYLLACDLPIEIAPKRPSDSKEVKEAKEYLKSFTTDLNARASAGKIDPVIGRTTEIDQVLRILMRRRKNNPLLIGEPGVGKTAIAEGLALRIVNGEVPEAFRNAIVYNLDVGQLVAGTKWRGDFEERVRKVIKAFAAIPNAIPFVDEIHLLMGSGKTSDSAMDAANLLKPALARGELSLIGATTHDEYVQFIESDKALLRRFKTVKVDEPTPDEAKAILMGLRDKYEKHFGVEITPDAIEAAVDLSVRYMRNAVLPDKAIDLIDGAGAGMLLLATPGKIDARVIEEEVARVTKVPTNTIRENDRARILALKETLQRRVFGQADAINTVCDAMKIGLVGLRSPNKPTGNFLFTGPTGVGKTELARALAEAMGIPLIRYDMSEYMEKHSVARLIGAPPGYVGHDTNAGLLVSDIDKAPYSVLLLDEIEKAHPDIFNVLLQVMDGASLTNGRGKRVDFRNVIVIMTSNVGAADLERSRIGFMDDDDAPDNPALTKLFSPEFRNRLDAIVNFTKPSDANKRDIVRKFVIEIADQLSTREIILSFTDDTLDFIAEKVSKEEANGRSIERYLTETIRLPVADLILNELITNGDEVQALVTSGDLKISRKIRELEKIATR